MALSSKKLYFRHNNTTYNLPLFTAKNTPFTIAVSDGSNTYYAFTDGALYPSYTENNIRYFYNSAKPSIHVITSGGTTCNAYNDSEIVYDIPAGTYTPSSFKSLIESYMSVGATRTCANSFTVTLNGVTTAIPANGVIYYSSFSSGSVAARLVGFGYNPSSYYYSYQIDRTLTTIYCVYCNNLPEDFYFYKNYENYPITIGTGIRFN